MMVINPVRPATLRSSTHLIPHHNHRITTLRRVSAQCTTPNTPPTTPANNAITLGLPALLLPFIADIPAALAQNREFGILEGQIFSLMHPAFMIFLFGASVYAGYLGFQWRHTRELADQIKTLKSQRTPAAVGPDGQSVPSPPSALDTQIAELEKVPFFLSCLVGRSRIPSPHYCAVRRNAKN